MLIQNTHGQTRAGCVFEDDAFLRDPWVASSPLLVGSELEFNFRFLA